MWLVALSTVFLAACTAPDNPVHPHSLDVVAADAIAGAYLEFTVAEGVALPSVSHLRDGVLARVSVVDGRFRVAWVGDEARPGNQVRIDFYADSTEIGTPQVVNANVLAGHDASDLGASSLSIVYSASAPTSTTSLALDPVDHGAVGITLQAAFADHPLGDLDGSGSVGIRDALWLLERMSDGAWTDFQRYHADLDADDVTDIEDLTLLLDKMVDPQLPARLHVKPRSVSFAQLDPATPEDAIVLIANQGRLAFTGWSWHAPDGVVTTNLGGIDSQSAALELTLPTSARHGWLPGAFRVTHAGESVDVRVGHLVFLIAGQSNAVGLGSPLDGWPEAPTPSVRVLGNDYLWRNASEPLDDATGQLDSVSDDGTFVRYSFGTRLGNLLHEATGFATYLIPAALGATSLYSGVWRPTNGAGVLDRGELFGSANYRAHVSAALQPNPVTAQTYPSEGGPVSAIVWYQGESDRRPERRLEFIANTNEVVDAFMVQLGAPVIAVQLASFCRSSDNTQIHAVSELQRRMETGFGATDERPGYHLVVAFDLPRSDCVHLSAYGQRVLAERISLAVRQHVLGESVDGTGPRMLSLSHAGDVVTLRTTHALEPGILDAGLFTVWDGPPMGILDDEAGGYYDNVIPVLMVSRSTAEPDVVRIVLSQPISDGQVPFVRYMAQAGLPGPSSSEPSYPELWEVLAQGVVRAEDTGLPLPAFGPLSPFGSP